MFRPLHHDPAARTLTELGRDDDGRLVARRRQDVAPVLEANRRAQGDFDPARHRRAPAGFVRVARLPLVIMQHLEARGIVRGGHVLDQRRFLEWLSDGDNAAFRTDDGRRLA